MTMLMRNATDAPESRRWIELGEISNHWVDRSCSACEDEVEAELLDYQAARKELAGQAISFIGGDDASIQPCAEDGLYCPSCSMTLYMV